jgi:hypothetical protein
MFDASALRGVFPVLDDFSVRICQTRRSHFSILRSFVILTNVACSFFDFSRNGFLIMEAIFSMFFRVFAFRTGCILWNVAKSILSNRRVNARIFLR